MFMFKVYRFYQILVINECIIFTPPGKTGASEKPEGSKTDSSNLQTVWIGASLNKRLLTLFG